MPSMYSHELEIGQECKAFGEIVKRAPGCFEVEEFKLIVWIEGTEETDVTASLSEASLKIFTQKLLDSFLMALPQEAS